MKILVSKSLNRIEITLLNKRVNYLKIIFEEKKRTLVGDGMRLGNG